MGGGSGIIGNSGLVLLIISKTPEELCAHMEAKDKEHDSVQGMMAATGIEDLLRKAGKQWFSLRPRLANEEERKHTGCSVVFWLNPMQQDKYNSMWCSLEQLKLWAMEKGPIVKSKE
jgi:hypothetical protein